MIKRFRLIAPIHLLAFIIILHLLPAIAVPEPPKDPAVETLVKNLGSPSSATVNQSISELVKIGAPAVPCLVQAYDKPVNVFQRHRIVFTASYIESPEVTPLLARYLNDEDRRINEYYDAVRKVAAKTDWIGDPNDTIVRPPTLSPDVRALCIDKLGRAKDAGIIPLFLKTLKAAPPASSLIKDSEKAVRQKIARMLSRFTDTDKPNIELLTAIEELLNDKDKEVVRWAIYALGRSSCSSAVSELQPTIGGSNSSPQTAAYKTGIDKLVKLTTNSDKTIAEYAVSALGNLKEQTALEPVRKCAKDSNPFFKACAQAAVRDITAEQPAVTPTLTAQELPLAKAFSHPLRDYLKDSSRKSFGKFIDPANIRPEAESFGNSIHVGDDCGWFQDGSSVYAIADGIVRYVNHIPTVKEGDRIS